MTSPEESPALKDLIALLKADLKKIPEEELVEAGRELELLLRHGFDLSARIVTELRRKRPNYFSWAKLGESLEVAQTTLWNRVHKH
jgi:hypothetical protein